MGNQHPRFEQNKDQRLLSRVASDWQFEKVNTYLIPRKEECFILNSNIVTLNWSNGLKTKFIKLGYKYTKNGDKFNVFVSDLSINSKAKVSVTCDYCGKEFYTTYAQYNLGRMKIQKDCCAKCTGKKSSEISLSNRAKSTFKKLKDICVKKGYYLITSICDFIDVKRDVEFVCPKHGLRKMSIDSLLHGHECIICSYEKRGNDLRLSHDDVYHIINSTNNNKLLNPNEYVNNITNNLKVKCSCGKVFTTSLANYKTQNRCSYCSQKESSGEKIIREYLEKNKISFIQEKRFEDCRDIKPLPFDFYLPDYNVIIEFDGKHHYFPIYGEDRLVITQKHDIIKNNYCKTHNIDIIRIPYWNGDKIEHILMNEIGKRYSLIS